MLRTLSGVVFLDFAWNHHFSNSTHVKTEQPEYNRTMDSPLLPEEILLDIFSRLPVKHVLRLKSLSRHLRRSLSTPHFAALHVRHQHRRRRVAVFESRKPPSSVAFRCVHTETHSDQQLISWGDDFKYSYPNARIWNSCDGLILFSISHKSSFAFNPFTTDRQLLRRIPPLCPSNIRDYSLLLGLGFDSLVDDYKVVGAVVYRDDHNGVDSFVFWSSLNSDSRLINKGFPYTVSKDSPGTNVNGVLYWLVERRGFGGARWPPAIVYFDFAAEVFLEMMTQLTFESYHDVYEYDLVVLRLALCVVCHRESQVEVLGLEKCGGMEANWVRLFVVGKGESLVFRTLKPLCFTGEGEVIMAVDRKRLVVYNLGERTHRLLFCHPEIQGRDLVVNPHGFEVVVYVESLVSPRSASKGYDGEMVDHSSTAFMDLQRRKENSYVNVLKRKGNASFSNSCFLPESLLPNIPTEIIIKILSFLPTKSLLRFMCVCKQWHSSISNPNFTLSFQKQEIAIWSRGVYNFNLHSLDDQLNLTHHPRPMPTPYKEFRHQNWLQILGSCNGLLLLYYFRDLYLWNPSTRQCTKVLWLPVPYYGEHFVSSGLCYDSSTDDYKAVFAPQSKEVIVASFKTKQCIKICFPHDTILNSGPLVKERLHWLASRSRNNGQYPPKAHWIFYFDPLKDWFFEFPSPLPINGEHNNILGLGVLDGCLCLVRYLDPEGIGSERDVEVLVMKEYGVGESWTSFFTISSVPCGPATFKGLVMVPFCFRKNGEVLIAMNGEKILVYDPNEESKRYIQIPNIGCNAQVMVYERSMVSPVAYRDEEGSTEGVRRWKTDPDWISTWCDIGEITEDSESKRDEAVKLPRWDS